jgi:energy-coupling factor transporter ATP-binding protein EcfA2
LYPVEFKDFSFTYMGRKRKALNSIDLKVEEGTITAILGSAGAGKTTLVHAMNGFIPNEVPGYSKGDVLVDGVSTNNVDPALLAEKVGLVLERPGTQLLALTVYDDIAFGPSNLGLTIPEIQERVEFGLTAARLKGLEKRNPEELSGGEQQSLAIAGILAMRPKLLALDEPVAMLDPEGKDRVLSVISSLVHEGKTTMVITESGSDLESIIKYLDRVVVLKQGEIVADGKPEKVLTSSVLDDVGVGRPQTALLFDRLGMQAPPEALKSVQEAKDCLVRMKITCSSTARHAPSPTLAAEPAVKVTNLSHTFDGEVYALNGVSLTVPRGEILGIIGQNGSGKSTLCLHMVGILKPSNPDSSVIVDGVDVTKIPTKEVIKHANYVFQNPDNQLFQEKVREELAYGLRMTGTGEADISSLVSDTLAKFGLEEYSDAYVQDLPRDAKTLLAIASVQVMKPKVLFVDEPTNGMDNSKANWTVELFKGFNRAGQTLVVVSHNMNIIAKLCSRVAVMKAGKIILEGSTREVFAQSDILKTANIRPPTITQISQSLSDQGFPGDVLTVEEFVANVSRRLS